MQVNLTNHEEAIGKSKLRDILQTTGLKASKCQWHGRPKGGKKDGKLFLMKGG